MMARAGQLCVAVAIGLSAAVGPGEMPNADARRQDENVVMPCSPHFLLSAPIHNRGDTALEIHRIRKDCPTCVKVKISGTRIEPGESALVSIWGRLRKEGRHDFGVFLETSDPVEPVKRLGFHVDYDKRRYVATIGWLDSGGAISYPLERAVRLESQPVTRAKYLTVELDSLGDRDITQLDVESAHFQLDDLALGDRKARLRLLNRVTTPGIYHDYLLLTINGNELLAIPLQFVLSGNCVVRDPCVSFSYVWEGASVLREVELGFGNEEDVWDDFRLETPPGVERAFMIEGIARNGRGAVLSIRIDAKFLGGSGFKTIPVQIKGSEDGEAAFVSFYGWVY